MGESDDEPGLAAKPNQLEKHDDELQDMSDDEDKRSNDELGPHDESAASSGVGVAGRKRRKCRRNRKAGEHHHSSGKRPYKPYSQMSWEERKVLDEKETKKANWRREQLIASGQAMAPYNTTQFLMEQHEPVGPSGDVQSFLNVLDKDSSGAGRSSGSVTGESSAAEVDDFTEDLFLEKEFSEAYENYHAERLQMMTKDELIREYVLMETKLERLQHEQTDVSNEPGGSAGGNNVKVEIKRLKEENFRLLKENEYLNSELALLKSPSKISNECPNGRFRLSVKILGLISGSEVPQDPKLVESTPSHYKSQILVNSCVELRFEAVCVVTDKTLVCKDMAGPTESLITLNSGP